MPGAWDALPAIIPFFGVMAVTMCGGFTCITRRINTLSRRLTNIEMTMTAPPKPIQTPPAQTAWQPNYPITYNTYPYPSAPAPTYPQQLR